MNISESVVVPTKADLGLLARTLAVGVGATLVTRVFRRRTSRDLVFAAIGTELLRWGVTGHSLFSRRENIERPELQDAVDIGSELSFPASDPPAY